MALLSALIGAGGGGKKKNYQLNFGSIGNNLTTANQAFTCDKESHVRIALDTLYVSYDVDTAGQLLIYIDDILQVKTINFGTQQYTDNQYRRMGFNGELGVDLSAGSHNIKLKFVGNNAAHALFNTTVNLELTEQP